MFNIITAITAVFVLMIFGIVDNVLGESKTKNRIILILGVIFTIAVLLLGANLLWRII